MARKLLIFASDECMGWETTRETIETLRDNSDFQPSIEVLDPTENQELFREYELTVCPSFLLDDELIAVGPTTPDKIQQHLSDESESS
jgi:hypothetical protein